MATSTLSLKKIAYKLKDFRLFTSHTVKKSFVYLLLSWSRTSLVRHKSKIKASVVNVLPNQHNRMA